MNVSAGPGPTGRPILQVHTVNRRCLKEGGPEMSHLLFPPLTLRKERTKVMVSGGVFPFKPAQI